MRLTHHITGMLSGLLLFYLWIGALLLLTSFLFAEKEVINGAEVVKVKSNQILDWLTASTFPILLVLEHHLILRDRRDLQLIKVSSIDS